MNYTLHQLQVFVRVVEAKSVTRAAEELHMTQPAVSIQLKNFQDQFEIPLTEVIGRKLYVTDFGMEIYTMAERILNEVYAINYKTMAYKGHLAGKLTFASVSTGKYVLPFFLSGFMNSFPGIDLSMDVTNKTQVLHSLQKNEIDFALVSVLPKDMDVNEEVLFDNELFLIGDRSFKSEKKSLTGKDLKSMPLIFREQGSGTRVVMENYFEKAGIPLRKKFELTSNEAIKQAIIAGMGLSILPLIGLRNELKSGELKIIPTSGFPIKSRWRIIWLKSKNLSPVATAYADYIRKNKDAIIKKYFSWMDLLK